MSSIKGQPPKAILEATTELEPGRYKALSNGKEIVVHLEYFAAPFWYGTALDDACILLFDRNGIQVGRVLETGIATNSFGGRIRLVSNLLT